MRINIEGDIYLSSNGTDGSLGYKLERKKIVDVKDKDTKEVTGTEEVYPIIGYYSTITNALDNGFLNLKIDASTAGNLKELNEDVKCIKDQIKTILGGI